MITLEYSILLSLFYLLSRGWGVLTFTLTRQEASNLTMIGICIYLCYSSMFLSQNFKDTQWVMKLVMGAMYAILGYKTIGFINTTILTLHTRI